MWDVRIAILGDTFYNELQQDGWEPFAMAPVPCPTTGGFVISMRKQVRLVRFIESEPLDGECPDRGNHTSDKWLNTIRHVKGPMPEWMFPIPKAD